MSAGDESKTIRILAADDHPLLREGIVSLIANQPDLVLIGEASTGREAIEKYRSLRPDVTLMDLQMPDIHGIDAIMSIRQEFPLAKIVVLTTFSGDVLAQRAIKAGAQAYILKSLVRKELIEVIRSVYLGRKRIQRQVAADIADHLAESLTHLELRKLELARALASEPRLLIADEVMAGLAENEIDEVLKTLFTLNDQGVTVVMIEHIMHAIMRFSRRLICMETGRIIADGAPQDVRRNPEVRRVYFGK